MAKEIKYGAEARTALESSKERFPKHSVYNPSFIADLRLRENYLII